MTESLIPPDVMSVALEALGFAEVICVLSILGPVLCSRDMAHQGPPA